MTEKKDGAVKALRAAGAMRELMATYFREADEAARTGSAKVAWCTSVGPAELLRALGFQVYFPENHAAMLGATRMASELIPEANAIGYSPDICSYLTSDVGSYLTKRTPLTRAYGMAQPPKPDVLVYNTNQCRDVQDWFAFYAREFGVPTLGVETPRNMRDVGETHVTALAAQHQALVPELERVAGMRLDIDRLREVVASSYRCTELWGRVLRTASKAPSPLTFFDGTIHMGPAVVLRGDRRAEGYYELLLRELEERVASGEGAVAGERHRLYWEGMPVWGKLKGHAEFFATHHTCVVASTYCNSWVFDGLADPDPFRGMARAYGELFITRAESYKEQYLERMAKDYAIGGFVFHDAKTCPNNSNNRYGMPGRLAKRLGLSFIVVDGDLNDLRLYSEEQALTQFEALLEQL